MALVKCKECGKDVSNTAALCPSCGAKVPKKTKMLTWVVAGFLAIGIGGALLGKNEPVKVAAPSVKRAPDKDSLQVALAREGAREIKSAMRDPASLKFESIRVNDDASVACFKYRAKNGFGGMNVGAMAIVNRKAMVKPEEFAKHCSKPMNDWTIAGD